MRSHKALLIVLAVILAAAPAAIGVAISCDKEHHDAEQPAAGAVAANDVAPAPEANGAVPAVETGKQGGCPKAAAAAAGDKPCCAKKAAEAAALAKAQPAAEGQTGCAKAAKMSKKAKKAAAEAALVAETTERKTD